MDLSEKLRSDVITEKETQEVLQLYFLNLNAPRNELSLITYGYKIKAYVVRFKLICINYQTKFHLI